MPANPIDCIVIRDANGQVVPVTKEEMSRVLLDNMTTLLGMPLPVIAQLRVEYGKRGGMDPMTVDSVKRAFQPLI